MYNKDIMRILYVEDEKLLAEAVIYLLEKNNIRVDHVTDGEAGLEKALHGDYDCIVLDIMLPKVSGLEILKTIRARNINTPVIMLSAMSQVNDKVHALDAGADDYLAKPFKTAELIARIQALNRRPPLKQDHVIKVGDVTYDATNRTLNGITLTSKEADILQILIDNPGQTQAKNRLLLRAWGDEANLEDNYVEVYVSYLRKKLQQAGSKAKIVAVRNLGYVFKPSEE